VSPASFDYVDLGKNRIAISASKQHIEYSPSFQEDHPLSHKIENELHRYYGWAPYWISEGLWGLSEIPTLSEQVPNHDLNTDEEIDASLRSIND
jgi:hypothetical protein